MLTAASLLAVALPVGLAAAPAHAVSNNLVISQVYGGGGNSGATFTHDFVELFNRGSAAVSLAGMSIQYASATGTGNFGSTTTQLTPLPDVTLQPGQYYLVQQASNAAVGAPLPTPDATDPSPIAMAGGAGKVALAQDVTSLGCNGSVAQPCSAEQLARIVDLVGYGNANFFEGSGAAPTLTATTAAFRGEDGCVDTDNNSADFAAALPAPRNTSAPLSPCGGPVDLPPTTTCPATLLAPFEDGASAPVSATDDNDDIGSIAITSAAVTGITLESVNLAAGTAVLTVAPTTAPGDYDVTVEFATDAATPQTATCTVAVTVEAAPLDVLISEVQGSLPASPLVGENVVVEGIVTSLFTNNDVPDGFFLQEEAADWDADPATSEGVFVFCRGECPAAGAVAVGDLVEVQGRVSEFSGMTQISSNIPGGSISVVSSGNPLPPAAEVALPADGSTRAAATFENIEGMVVEFSDTLVVSEYFELARFGQLILTVDERPYQFTHDNLPSVDGYSAFLEDLNTRRIILDDDNSNQNDAVTGPDDEPYPWPAGGLWLDNRVRGGDTIDGLTGVMHWANDAWRIRPIQGMDYEFTTANPAPAEPEDVGGRLTVTSYNVLNYFATVNAANVCGPLANQDCRGADSEIERERQLTKIAAGLAEIDADVAGLIEIENDGDDAAVNQIVDALNGLTAPGTYAAIETGFIGTDAIKVALIYQPATVTPVGDYAILDSSDDPRFIDTANRPVLIQTFEENSTGERFTIAVNHLKSKGSDCNALGDPNLNDGQGNCNETRTLAVQALMDHLAQDPTGSGDPDFLIVGDLNSYAMEDPITSLEAAGWTDLHEEFEGPTGYSYVFDGQLGYLDTALANESLLPQVTGTTAWHINADEFPLFDYNDEFLTGDEASFERESNALPLYAPDPLRSSDHDPVVVGLSLGDPAEVVSDLRETLAEMGIQRGITNSLDAKLRAALADMAADDTIGACTSLQSFIDQVNALTGNKITPAQASILIEEAVIARVMLDC
ncbi:MAG TPA: ExeM/NucH family extracellular endonuclease [Ornithinibacter sp.]|nr:ExeM/NucH family extracellular endonuclease [Ornithinibacter sp.]